MMIYDVILDVMSLVVGSPSLVVGCASCCVCLLGSHNQQPTDCAPPELRTLLWPCPVSPFPTQMAPELWQS